ncbi:hypothetical protein [Microcoleus sp. herbarium2]
MTNNTQGFQDLLSEAMDNTQEPGLNLLSFLFNSLKLGCYPTDMMDNAGR